MDHRESPEQVLPEPERKTFVEALMEMPDVGEDEDFARVQDDERERPSTD